MRYNRFKHHRRSIRIKGYDYASAGAYFVTTVVQNRGHLFGEIIDDKMFLNDAGKMVRNIWLGLLTRFSNVFLDEYIIMPNHFHGILFIDGNQHTKEGGETILNEGEYKIRPNDGESHEAYKNRTGESCIRPSLQRTSPDLSKAFEQPNGTANGSLGRIIQAFKSLSTNDYIKGVKDNNWQPFDFRLWQRDYYEHIIRTEKALYKIREYIADNPLNWRKDKENFK